VAEQPFISVIIPAHNAAAYLYRTIQSVLRQSHPRLEVIVVDDGSTDQTAAIVKSLAQIDKRVRLIESQNRGASAARNLAISHAKYALIAPIDADDIWHPQKIERQLAVMQSSGRSVGVVYCWSVGIDDEDRVILPTWNNGSAAGKVLEDIIVSGILGNGSTPLIRRSCIDAVGGYDNKLMLCEDWKFYTALSDVCEFAVVPQYLTGYRLRADSASIDVRRMEKAIAEVTAWIENRWPDLPERILKDRRHVVDAYLASLAIRERKFADALRFLLLAFEARPHTILSYSFVRLFFMFAAHALGLRIYRWDFWKKPDFFEFCKTI
jgi:glycosyltransferase involved in cell wall biosynthesis